jgi:hypothetical protein
MPYNVLSNIPNFLDNNIIDENLIPCSGLMIDESSVYFNSNMTTVAMLFIYKQQTRHENGNICGRRCARRGSKTGW